MSIVRITRGCALAFAVSICCVSCSYGPPKVHVGITNCRAKPGSHVIAIAIDYRRVREPTGLNRFPDGGRAKVLEEEVRVYVYDATTGALGRVATLPHPSAMSTSCEPWILGWHGGMLHFKLSGQSGTSVADIENLVTVVYRVESDGEVNLLNDAPVGIEAQRNTGPFPKGPYIRVSHGHDSIDIRTETDGDWRRVLNVDGDGELQVVRP